MVEVRKAVYANSPALLDSHFSYSHNSLSLEVSILFPLVKLLWASWSGEPFFRAGFPADTREDKASVRSEGADGIPQFLRHEKICGRLPSSPPTESVSGTWRSSRPQFLCTTKKFPAKRLKRGSTIIHSTKGHSCQKTAANVNAFEAQPQRYSLWQRIGFIHWQHQHIGRIYLVLQTRSKSDGSISLAGMSLRHRKEYEMSEVATIL